MKANEYLTPKRVSYTTILLEGESEVPRQSIDYGEAIYRKEFDGFGKQALSNDFEAVEDREDVEVNESITEERD